MEIPKYVSEMDVALALELAATQQELPTEQVLVARRWARLLTGNPYKTGFDLFMWNEVGGPDEDDHITGCSTEGLVVHHRPESLGFAILDILTGEVVDWQVEGRRGSVMNLVGSELPNMAAGRDVELVFPGSPIDDALIAKQGLIARRSAACRHGYAIVNEGSPRKLTFGGMNLSERQLAPVSALATKLNDLENKFGKDYLYMPPNNRMDNLSLADTMS